MVSTHVVRSGFAVTMTAVLLAGCASTGQISELETTHYTERLETRTDGGMRVSTSVLSDAEAKTVYGVPLADKGIQPVWIEIENNNDSAYWLLLPGIDPNFFPASEAADVFAGSSARTNRILWKSPMQYHGQNVWVGQISRDIGTRLTIHSPYLTTHKIDPDVDEALVALIEDLACSQNLSKFGLAERGGPVT